MRAWLARLGRIVARRRQEREVEEELRFHLESEIEERVRCGMTPEEARRTALRDFGGWDRQREAARDVRRLRWLEDGWRDGLLAARSLRRRPIFTVGLVLLLSVAIGAVASIWGVVDGVLLRPVPYDGAESLVVVWNRRDAAPSERVPVAAPHLAAVAEAVEGIEELAFTDRVSDVTVGASVAPVHARLAVVTANFFDVLRVRPLLGPGFGPAGGASGDAAPAVVLSHGFWRQAFGSDTALVGGHVDVDGVPRRVAGVLPPDFRAVLPPDVGLPGRVDLWTPLAVELGALRRDGRLLDRDSDNSGLAIVRLAPGADPAAVREALGALTVALRETDAGYAAAGLTLSAMGLAEAVGRGSRPILLVLLMAGVVLLAGVATSVAGLLLMRLSSRERELRTRAALGAGRARLLRQLLAESAVLVLAALGPGLALAVAGHRLLALSTMPALRDRALEVTWAVPAAALATALSLALVLAVLPARHVSRLRLDRPMGATRVRPGVRSVLVAAQIALAFSLLVGGGLLVRRVAELRKRPLGFQPERTLAFDLSLRYPGVFDGPADRARYIAVLERALEAAPGVEGVGLIGRLPLAGRSWTQPYGDPGTDPAAWSADANFRAVTSGFFAAAGTRLLAGRGFSPDEDLYERRRVAVVGRALARRLAPAGDPASAVGRRIAFPLDGAPVTAEIVGVVEDIRFEGLATAARPTLYVPYRQEASREVSMVTRTRGDPGALVGTVREAVRSLGVPLAPYNVRPLESYVAGTLAADRLASRLVTLFALLTLITALAGVYGLVTYTARLRRAEMAIRLAAGARPRDLVLGFVRWGAGVSAAGIAAGAILMAAAWPLLRTMTVGPWRLDLAWAAGLALGLAALTLAASALGGGDAARVRPMDVLRGE